MSDPGAEQHVAERDEISRILDGLDDETLTGYAQRGAPDATDEAIAELVRLLSLLTRGEREQIMYGWFEPAQLEALTLFSMRMTALAMQQRDPDLVRNALVALAFEGFRDIADEQVGDALLETIREAAVALGQDPAALTTPVLELANPEMSERLRAFYLS